MKQSIKHYLLTMLLAFVSLSAAAADYDFEVDGMYYSVVSISDLTCAVVAGDTKYTGDIVIPATVTYNGRTLSVTSIGEEAFEYCWSLTSVEIPNSVTSIGEEAFHGCDGLISVVIPNSVTSIGNSAFYSCSSLTSVEIPNSVTSIGEEAFEYCRSLTSVEIPNSVTSIGDEAFYGSGIKTLIIPDSVTKIGMCCVVGSSIREIKIGSGIKKLPFDLDRGIKDYYSKRTVTLFYDEKKKEDGTIVGLESCDSLSKITFADTNVPLSVVTSDDINCLPCLREIYLGRNIALTNASGGNWFYQESSFYISNTHLKKIEYGDSVTVEKKASGCTGLEEIVYGKGISKISPSNISDESLKAIYVKADTPPTVSGTFTNKTYLNVKLYVPRASLAAYQTADVWKNFWNMEAYDYASGIEAVTTKDDAPKGIYDLQGRKLSAPQKGINIVDGKKVIVK